jgi:hypothetical protein
MRLSIVGAYVQDDWRFRPNLTLNLGLRYEMSTVLTETKGKLTNLPTIDAAHPICGILFGDCTAVGPYFSNPTLRNFEPRVGFAWDPFRNGKTAVRGGFGMFDVLPMLYTTVTLNGRGAPFFAIANSTDPVKLQGSFPNGALSSIGATTGLEYAYVEPHPHRNYVMQWNLNVQRQLAPSLTAMVGYVGSHGVHQAFRTDDSRMVIPIKTSAGYIFPLDGSTLNNVNDNVGDIRLLDWAGSSSYHALQVGIKKQMSHGLQIQGSYTWGKSIDNNSGVVAGDTLANGIGSLQYFDLSLSRGLSDYNIGRVLVINGSWQLPTAKSLPAPLGWAVNGWEFGGILKVNDGPPLTPTFGTGGDPSLTGSGDDWAYPDRLTGPGCQSLVHPGDPNNYIKTECFALPTAPASFASQCMDASDAVDPAPVGRVYCLNRRGNAGRNIIPGAGLVNLDLSFFKNNPIRRISENFNVQFRAEIFNVLNRANFSLPVNPDDTDIFDDKGAPLNPPDNGTAGTLKSTTTSARLVQFAIKVIW